MVDTATGQTILAIPPVLKDRGHGLIQNGEIHEAALPFVERLLIILSFVSERVFRMNWAIRLVPGDRRRPNRRRIVLNGGYTTTEGGPSVIFHRDAYSWVMLSVFQNDLIRWAFQQFVLPPHRSGEIGEMVKMFDLLAWAQTIEVFAPVFEFTPQIMEIDLDSPEEMDPDTWDEDLPVVYGARLNVRARMVSRRGQEIDFLDTRSIDADMPGAEVEEFVKAGITRYLKHLMTSKLGEIND